MKPSCPHCAAIRTAARLTLTPAALRTLELDAEMEAEDGAGAGAPLTMLLQFYRNVKAALANGVRGDDHRGGSHGQ